MDAAAVPPFLPGRSPLIRREVFEGVGALLADCPMVGWARFDRADTSLAAHAHVGSYEICYIVRGNVEWWVGSQIFNLGPGDVFVTSPREAHGGVDAFMHPCELYWAQVRGSNRLSAQLADLRRHFRGGPVLIVHFERLLAEHRLGGADTPVLTSARRGAARAALSLLVTDVLRFHEAAALDDDRPAQLSPRISVAMQHMHANFGEPHCLDQATRASGLGGTQFRKRFQLETGYSPHDYLTRAQVQEAKKRLAHTHASITEVSFDLGFSSSQYFATVFRKLVGLTPQEYRRRHTV